MQRQFTSNEVIALTEITARQLQWWDERGIVAPVRQGHRRIYNWDELVTVALVEVDILLVFVIPIVLWCRPNAAGIFPHPSPD